MDTGHGESSWAMALRAPATKPESADLGPDLAQLLGDNTEEQPALSPRLAPERLLNSLWVRKEILVGVPLVAMILASIFAVTMIQHRWQGVTTLILQQDNEELSVGGGKPYKAPLYGLETLLDTLKLPSSLAEARDRADIDVSLTALASSIDVSTASQSSVLNLKVLWPDAQTAATLTNHLADVFVEKTQLIRIEQAERDHERYLRQLQDAAERVQQADERILTFQRQHKVSNFEEEIKARLRDLSRLEAEYRTQSSEVDFLRTAKGELQAAIDDQPEVVVSSILYRNPLKKRLEDYRWQLKEARSRYTADNPKVIKLEREVGALRRLVEDNEVESSPESTHSPNGLRHDMQLELHKLNDELRVAEGRTTGLQASVNEITEKLSYLNTREKEFLALKADQNAARLLESSLAAKAEESRVAAMAGEPAFRILERANVPETPVGSGRKILVAAIFVLSVGATLLLVFLLELRDPRVRDQADASALAPDAIDMAVETSDRPRIDPGQPEYQVIQTWRRFVNDIETDGVVSCIAIVGAETQQGCSTVAWNLAAGLALRGDETVLVDADLREKTERRFSDKLRPGFTDVITGRRGLSDCLAPSSLRRLRLLPPGTAIDNHSAMTFPGTSGARDLALQLRQLPGRVIIDLPPLANNEAALEFAAAIGTVVFVSRSGYTDRSAATQLVERLDARGVRILGSVVLDVPKARIYGANRADSLPKMKERFSSQSRPPREVQHA